MMLKGALAKTQTKVL